MALLKSKNRKIIGTFFILVLIVLYSLIVVTLAASGLAQAAWYIHVIFFATSGIIWILPAMIIVKWMIRP